MVPLKLNLSLKQKLFLLGLLTLTSAMIISLTWWTIGALAPTAATDSGDDLTPVRVSATEKQTLRRVFSIYTSLLPWKEAFIKPQTQGSVTSVFVQVGDLVQKDQKLFSLSSESQRLRAELDQIDFQLCSVDYQVAMALAQKNFISRKEQHQKQLEHRSSKIRARLSVLDNGGAYVSPFDGLISESGLRAGDFVDGTSIQGVRIVDVSKLKMAFWIPQSMASLISIDSEAFEILS